MTSDRDDIGLREGASFQAKIASVALITTAVVLLTACLAFVFQQYGAERRAMATQNRALASILAPHVGEEIAGGRQAEAAAIVDSLAQTPGVGAVYLIDGKGEVLARSRIKAGETGGLPARTDETVVQARSALRDRDGAMHGELVIVADAGRLTPILAKYLAVSFALFFAATGMAMFMSKWLAARLIRPVNVLGDAMLELAESGDFSRRAPVVGDPVFARLSESFNELMVRLQANDAALRHTLRELTVARDAAEAANVLKSQFLANMSHEIRTPLNGVLAMAQIMEMSQLDPRQRERLTVIRHSGETLLTVLNDVLDLSKIEAGKMELEVTDFDAAEVARGVALNLAPVAVGKRLSFVLDIHPTAEGLRRGDAARLRQILSNLASNAIKFTATGEVKLTIVGRGDRGAESLAIIVADTGPG
jgi:signal transduction histidine kinase